MKKLLMFMAFLAMLSTPALAGPTVTMYGTPYSSGAGGEFAAVPDGWGWDPLVSYADSTKDLWPSLGPSFQTFCLELSEPLTMGVLCDVTFSDRAILGGVGPSGDPLSAGAAWLYHGFQNGNLEGYNYADTPAGSRRAVAGALQNTIWWLEGENSDPGNGNFYRNLVLAQFVSEAGAMADNNGLYPVMVMNLWTLGHAGDFSQNTDGSYKYLLQDTLVCSIPAPGAILLGGIGVALVGWLRGRRTL